MKKVILLSDSNMSGATNNNFEAAAYCASVTDDLIISNLAISGQMARKADHYYRRAVTDYPQDGIIVMLGSNDHWTAPAFGDSAGDYYQHLVGLIQLRPTMWVIVSPPPGRDRDIDYGGGNLHSYRCLAQMAAEATGSVYVDSWKVLRFPEDYQDHIHLSDAGRAKLLDAIVTAVNLSTV